MGDDCSYVIRAIGPDNVRFTDALAEFYKTFPVAGTDSAPNGIYARPARTASDAARLRSREYWRAVTVSRFVNLVAIRRDEIIGHLLYSRDSVDRSVICLRQRRFAGDDLAERNRIAAAMYAFLLAQTERSGASLVWYIDDQPQDYAIDLNLPGSVPVAALPLSELGANGAPSLAVIRCRLLRQGQTACLEHLPPRYAEFLTPIYRSLKQASEWSEVAQARAATPTLLRVAASTDSAPEEALHFRAGNTLHLVVKPSKLSSYRRERLFNKGSRRNAPALWVALNDPATPDFAAELEERQYLLAGMLPRAGGQDNLIFVRPDDYSLESGLTISPASTKFFATLGLAAQSRNMNVATL